MSFAQGWNDGEVLYASDMNDMREFINDIGNKLSTVTFQTSASSLTTVESISAETIGQAVTEIAVDDLQEVVATVNNCVASGGTVLLSTSEGNYHLTGFANSDGFNLHNYNFYNQFSPIGNDFTAYTLTGSKTQAIKLELNET